MNESEAWNGESDRFITDERDTWKSAESHVDNETAALAGMKKEVTNEFVEGMLYGMELCANLLNDTNAKAVIYENEGAIRSRWQMKSTND